MFGTRRSGLVARRGCSIMEDAFPFSGTCYDVIITRPIKDFISKPYGLNLRGVLDECFEALRVAVVDEIESVTSFEYFKELSEDNDWEYFNDGERYI